MPEEKKLYQKIRSLTEHDPIANAVIATAIALYIDVVINTPEEELQKQIPEFIDAAAWKIAAEKVAEEFNIKPS